jgi:hypothetical protein
MPRSSAGSRFKTVTQPKMTQTKNIDTKRGSDAEVTVSASCTPVEELQQRARPKTQQTQAMRRRGPKVQTGM